MRARGLRHLVMGLGLHRVDEVGELDRVLDEEHRHVVADQVPVAFVGVELDGEAAHVARRVLGAAFARDGREADKHRRDFSGLLEGRGLGVLRQRLVGFEETVRARATRMHDALGDALVVEVRELLAQDEVLEQRRPARAGLQGVLVVGDRHALVGGEHLARRVHSHAVQRIDGRVHALGGCGSRLRRGIGLRERAAGGRARCRCGGCAHGRGLRVRDAMLERLVRIAGHGGGKGLRIDRLLRRKVVASGGRRCRCGGSAVGVACRRTRRIQGGNGRGDFFLGHEASHGDGSWEERDSEDGRGSRA